MLYLQSATKRTRWAVLGMLSAIMLAYLAAAAGFVATLSTGFLAIFLLLWVFAWAGISDRRVLLTLVLATALVILSVGVPSDGWDARSIWLFHGKRIFVDASLYSQLDGYAGWSQNDYPSLVPMMMAGLARLAGGWNELLPKVSGTLLLLPALLVIALGFRQTSLLALFFVPLLMLGGVHLINGYMDALVAVYATASVVAVSGIVASGRQTLLQYSVVYALLTAVLVLLKNEALVVAAAVFAAASLAFVVRQRKLPMAMLSAFLLGLIPLLLWKWSVSSHNVVNDLAASNVASQLRERLPNIFYSVFILEDLLLRLWVLLPLLVLVLMRGSLKMTSVQVALLAASAYCAVLYVVYLSTPHDVRWHLQTSSSRTVMPLAMMIVYAALAAIDSLVSQLPALNVNERIQDNVR